MAEVLFDQHSANAVTSGNLPEVVGALIHVYKLGLICSSAAERRLALGSLGFALAILGIMWL